MFHACCICQPKIQQIPFRAFFLALNISLLIPLFSFKVQGIPPDEFYCWQVLEKTGSYMIPGRAFEMNGSGNHYYFRWDIYLHSFLITFFRHSFNSFFIFSQCNHSPFGRQVHSNVWTVEDLSQRFYDRVQGLKKIKCSFLVCSLLPFDSVKLLFSFWYPSNTACGKKIGRKSEATGWARGKQGHGGEKIKSESLSLFSYKLTI